MRGSKRVLGSCQLEKRPGRLQREETGCQKEERGKGKETQMEKDR